MAKFLILAVAMTSFASAEPVVQGEIKLERSTCTATSTGETCTDYTLMGSKPFSVSGDNGKADYVEFNLGDGQIVAVKVGTNGGKNFFLTTGIYAHNSSKPFIVTGDTILEVDKKDGLRSAQIYSPTYSDNGTLHDLKATITFTNFAK
jgi:hypothetical protein